MVRAVAPVERGEEVCISYMSPLQRADFHARSSRRRILQTEFGFHCLCDICAEEDKDKVEADDHRRRRVLQIEEEWGELGERQKKKKEEGRRRRFSF